MYYYNDINLSWTRTKKGYAMLQAYKEGITEKKELKIEIYDSAIIFPYSFSESGEIYGGGVSDKEGEFIPLSKINVVTPESKRGNKIICSDEVAVYCGGCRAYGPHWGHFLVDVVSRLWYALLKNAEPNVSYIVVGTEERDYSLEGNFLEFFKLLGIEKRVRFLSKATKFKRVIIPEKSYDFDTSIKNIHNLHYYSREYLQTFDYVIKRAMDKQHDRVSEHKKLYLIRDDRRDSGIELIHNLFLNNGFEMINPVEITLTELIFRLQKCEVIAYVTGTLQHNLLFAPSGIKAVAIERRAEVSPIQIDIDLIKNIRADYIDAHYSIVPDQSYYYGLYGYTNELRCYVESLKWNTPDSRYIDNEYCMNSVREYMKKYIMSNFESTMDVFDEYIYEDCQESLAELEKIFEEKIRINKEDFFDIEKAKQKIKEMLINLRICYSEWNDENWRTAHDSLSKLVRNVLRKNVHRFLIYPYGKNGMLLKQILENQYGIEGIIIFDNYLSDINKTIRPLCEIVNYYTEESCIILTSSIRECWENISLYVNLMDIEGPFSVIRYGE